MQSAGQKITFGLAVVLIVASLWRGNQIQPLWNALLNKGGDNIKPPLISIGGDLAFLIIVVWIAGLGPHAATITGALLVALWLLFLLKKPDQVHAGQAASANIAGITTAIGV